MDPAASASVKQQNTAQANLRALSSELSSAGVFQEHQPWEGRRRDRCYGLFALLIALAVLGWALLSLKADRTGTALHSDQDFCCYRLLTTLAEVGVPVGARYLIQTCATSIFAPGVDDRHASLSVRPLILVYK